MSSKAIRKAANSCWPSLFNEPSIVLIVIGVIVSIEILRWLRRLWWFYELPSLNVFDRNPIWIGFNDKRHCNIVNSSNTNNIVVDIVCLQNHHITYINNRLLNKAIPFMRNSIYIQCPNNSPRTTGKIRESQEYVTVCLLARLVKVAQTVAVLLLLFCCY